MASSIIDLRNVYKVGDTISFGSNVIFAGISTNTKSLYFTIPLNKPVVANGIRFDSIRLTVRGAEGRIISDLNIITDPNYTSSFYLNATGISVRVMAANDVFSENKSYNIIAQSTGTFI